MTSEYTYLKRVKVNTANLELGMYVSELDKKWSDSPFLFQGFPLSTEDDILEVQKECRWVYVDFKSREAYHAYLKSKANPDFSGSQEEVKSRLNNELSFELPRANSYYKSSRKLVKDVMQSVLNDEDFDLNSVKVAVEDCIESILSNQDALLLLSNIKNADEYTAEHCLRVAIMAIAFGRYVGFEEEDLKCLGIGALLHDVGKMKVPDKILNKPGKLTPAEFNIMKDHAIEGFKILKRKPALSEIAIDIAHSHHERLNGEGYPRKIQSHQISKYTRLVTIVDTYDAVTSERIYSSAKSPSTAFGILRDNAGKHFDKELVEKFIEWMGIYPVGSLVELKTGEVGIVLKVYQAQKLKPRILLVTDEKKESGYEKVVDLSHMAVHSSGSLYQVKSVLPNGAYGINLENFITDGLVAHQ
ncbi:HD-GYP domain-containing protein [Aliikangiella sp. G2MR2-5]|uniref:HD-GYP domain-containing protein n=1 Tax=Aliikangiella sp. G2MR2-5 TaxID=2788943 RepID=UPI0018AB1753|nr:HD-GYP domain-containing protein [Aliikangiella sp. G2MR2-5]